MTRSAIRRGGRRWQEFDETVAAPAAGFGNVTSIAARLFAARMAAVALVEEGTWRSGGDELPDRLLCDHALDAPGVFIVPDAGDDPRFAGLPGVVAGRLRFLAAAPLATPERGRVGILWVADSLPRGEIAAEDARHLAALANLVSDEIASRAARQRLTDELAARRLAEDRLKLLNELTEATLAASDSDAGMAACLRLVAEHVGADGAFAHELPPHAQRLEVAAEYVAPGNDLLVGIGTVIRDNSPIRRAGSLVVEALVGQQLVAVPEITAAVAERFPRLGIAARKRGVRSVLAVPFANAGTRFALTFLFRRPPEDMTRVAETVHGLSGKVRDLLARKQTEEHIALLQSVALHTSDAVIICEAGPRARDGLRIVYVNHSFTALTGYPSEEALGRTPNILRKPRASAAAFQLLRETAQRRQPVTIELSLARRDGSEFWAEMEVIPVADANGRPSRWISILRDRTEHRRAEHALKERELALRRLADRQAAVLDALPAHVALLDGGGRIVEVGKSWPAFARNSGRAVTGAGDSYEDFIAATCAEDHVEAVVQGVRDVLAGRLPQFNADFACDLHRRRWYRLVIAPIANGAVPGAVAMHLDVTESKLAEDALRQEKEFSDFLIKSSTEGIMVFDRHYRITLWNPGISAITGLDQAAVLGRRVFEALPSLIDTPAETAMRDVFEGYETAFYDQRYMVPATGREGYFEGYFSPCHSPGREVTGGIGFLRETTERRRIEDALRQSQKMEAVGQLTGGIAHDFNNMLTVIGGNLELLETKLGDEPRLLRLINSAALAASRAEKLTQQLLTFSRRQQLRPQAIDFNQIVIGMDDLVHRTVGESIEIRTSLSPELWPALADPNQIETALLNLVLNARDAMPEGGRITIETANVEIGPGTADTAAGAYATLSVSDSGHGMSEEILAHVFEPFFTTKEVGKGTGLGLSQVYGFIKQSAGHIKIESELGIGTVVRLYLPRAEGAAGSASMTPMREQPYRGSELVLVVEDDLGVRDFAVSILRELGYRVLEAANGDIALDLLDAHADIDLLFTDVVMPGSLNGADLARAARARRPDLRVLFTSGYTTRLVEKDWPEHSVELLRKPYRSIDLGERIRTVLDRGAHSA